MKFIKAVFVFIGLVFCVAGVGVSLHIAEEPLTVLERYGNRSSTAVPVIFMERQGNRMMLDVTLETERAGTARFAVSLPHPLPQDEKLPVLLVLGGLGMGEENLRYLPDAGANVLVGYDWPFPPKLPKGARALFSELPALHRDAHRVPAQIEAGMEWLTRQSYIDQNRISLLGFSLGTLVGPAVQNFLTHRGYKISATVMGYGGAPIGTLVAAHPRVEPDRIRKPAGFAVNLLLWHLDPVRHLPQIESGRFLLLTGADDRLIPQEAAERYINLAPDPKQVLVFDGDHMGVGQHQMELLDEIIAASRDWLVAERAINPPPPPPPQDAQPEE